MTDQDNPQAPRRRDWASPTFTAHLARRRRKEGALRLLGLGRSFWPS